MLWFVCLNGYAAKDKAGHGVTTYDTTIEQDKQSAEAEFARLLAEGRTALLDGNRVTTMPNEGEVTFLLPMMGG